MIKLNYKLNEKNVITEYTIIPFDETLPFVEIADDQVINVGYSKIVDGVFYSNEEEFQKIKNAKIELKEIQKWFKENDWIINKVAVGEWTVEDKRWISYLEERKEKRERQDELNEVINNG